VVALRAHGDRLAGSDAIVFDTATRHLDSEAAGRAVFEIASEARRRQIRFVYKKTDSTLRGNIAAEFSALLRVFPDMPLIYAPAYPGLGRTVRAGRLYIDGVPLADSHFSRDRLNPSKQDSVVSLLERGMEVSVRSINPEGLENCLAHGDITVWVCDSETDADLDVIGRAVAEWGHPYVVAGTGAFARIWAERLPVVRRAQTWSAPRGPFLVVNGSLHPASLAQVEQSAEPVFRLGTESAGDARCAEALANAVRRGGWAVLSTTRAIEIQAQEAASRLANIAAAVVQNAPVWTLIIFGGDTTEAILRELHVESVEPLGEIFAGVPAAEMAAAERAIGLVTKAGGFGSSGALADIRRVLERQE
jgi:uncharacterized protein YgbK (DUF1537 family)